MGVFPIPGGAGPWPHTCIMMCLAMCSHQRGITDLRVHSPLGVLPVPGGATLWPHACNMTCLACPSQAMFHCPLSAVSMGPDPGDAGLRPLASNAGSWLATGKQAPELSFVLTEWRPLPKVSSPLWSVASPGGAGLWPSILGSMDPLSAGFADPEIHRTGRA